MLLHWEMGHEFSDLKIIQLVCKLIYLFILKKLFLKLCENLMLFYFYFFTSITLYKYLSCPEVESKQLLHLR